MPIKQLNQDDHDLLIRLDTKFDQMSTDIKSLADGTAAWRAVVEQKVDAHQKIIDEINPLQLAKNSAKHDQFIHDFRTTWKLIALAASAVGSSITVIIELLLSYFHLLQK